MRSSTHPMPKQVWQLALAHIPDLILLDLGLPDYDGQTLAGWLRAKSVLDATPIVAVTAWPQETAKAMVESSWI